MSQYVYGLFSNLIAGCKKCLNIIIYYHKRNPIGRMNMQNGIIKGASSVPAIDRTPISRPREFKIKFLALFLTCVMVVSALAIVLPEIVSTPYHQVPAGTTANNGQPEIHYNYSDFFHMTFQDWNWNRSGGTTFETAGHHESDPSGNVFHDRMPTWYLLREPNYGEYIYRQTYPHIWYYNPYSTQTTPDVSVGWVAYAPVKFQVWARNITTCKTTTDAIFVPDLDGNPARPNGGWINISYYMTYIGYNEFSTLRGSAGGFASHWVSWLYGVELRTQFPAATSDDGYWCHFMGQIQYSRQAAMSYLGWDGTGDVRTWFQANEETIEQGAWFDDWMAEGSGGGAYDIYTAYDYPIDIRVISLQYDALNSTENTISFRVYTFSWGMDALIVRYLEASGVLKNAFQGWMEDMDLKIQIGPNMMNLSLSANVNYQLQYWEDDSSSVWSGGWKLENMHMDWCGNTATHNSYPSPYNKYDPDQTNWLTESRSPWTTHFGQGVSYWVAPLERDLQQWEYIKITLNPDDVICFRPNPTPVTDETQATYLSNLRNNQYWGRMVLGKGSWPYDTIASAYDPSTKTILLKGPIDFPIEVQPGTTDVLLHGVPAFMFDVSPVSYYTVTVTGPHTTTLQDTITIRGYNGTGAVMPTWYNGTVVLSDTDPGANPASTSHTWVPGDNGVWSTTITWATAGTQYVNATDQWFDLDVKGSSGPISVSLIPEFSTLLIPTIGAIAIFLVFRTKRRRKSE
jgi:hypothetical protein